MKRIGTILALLAVVMGFFAGAQAQTPPAPTDLVAGVVKTLPPSVELWWKLPPIMPPVFPTAFKVYRGDDDSTALDLLGITNGMKYHDYKVEAGHTYFYAVSTVWKVSDTLMESGKSKIASATIQPPPPVAHGTIEGTVIDSLSGAPVPFARVFFFSPASTIAWVPQATADSIGTYKAALDTATYYILCRPPMWMEMSMSILPPYLPEWYKDARNPWDATPVDVGENSVTTVNFDLVRFSLPPLAHVTGTVMDSSGNALKGAWVFLQHTMEAIQDASGGDPNVEGTGEAVTVEGLGCIRGLVWKGRTDSLGHFDALVLSGRSYVALAMKSGYLPQFYDHAVDPSEAKAIEVKSDVAGINFNLLPLTLPQTYSLSGVVQDSAGVRIPSRIVLFPIYPLASVLKTRFVFTDALGAYAIPNVVPGRYHVLAIPFGRYAPSFYKAGEYGVFRWKDADTVRVSNADVTGIDIGVVRFTCPGIARLKGYVRRRNAVLSGVRLIVHTQSGSIVGCVLSDHTGAYTIDNLPTGQLTVTVDHEGFTGTDQPLTVASSSGIITQDFTLEALTSVRSPSSPVTPESFSLRQNYPNPFNPSTVVSFQLPVASNVKLTIFDILGREVETLVNEAKNPGTYSVTWNASGKASGIYFYRIEAGSFAQSRKMLLIK